MIVVSSHDPAFGKPGIEPRWSRGAKEGVGTAYSASSRLWFTASAGVVTEVYYPTIDKPQVRDLQFLITDGRSFFHDERRHLTSRVETLDPHSLGLRIINRDPDGRYSITKEIISDPHQPCLLVRTSFDVTATAPGKLRLFALLAPHLGSGGWRNSGHVVDVAGRVVLTARSEKQDPVFLAMGASVPFAKSSCGYVGTSDGWTDLSDNFEMDWQFDSAEDGNVALTGELDLSETCSFTLGLAFGDSLHSAIATLSESLGFPFERHRRRFGEQWSRACLNIAPLESSSGDEGALYHTSHSVLLAHEDKTFSGAMIASLGIPWGETKGDSDLGGYHLVWTRDMVNSATALLASGNSDTPLRSLIYLACSQNADGGFAQNFWLDGTPYWAGIQLDEVAFPILLARRLRDAGGLQDFDPYTMVMRAAGYLLRHGPATPQERWEENGGYSPSTLASNIAAIICAACFAREKNDVTTARFLEDYADFLRCHVEAWTVTTRGRLHPEISRHFIRIQPLDTGDSQPDENPDDKTLSVKNRPPGEGVDFPARDIVDAGFLELVRYGVLKPGTALVEDSLEVVDRVLKVDTPFGPCWRRYNHDGYGQRDDGGAYQGWGRGRPWPLLTGERGHYELSAGRDARPYVEAMERFASGIGMLPEQVWDDDDRPDLKLFRGRPTGAAMPLMWAHAEYVKLLRSCSDAAVFDRVPEVEERYRVEENCTGLEIWKFNRMPRFLSKGWTLRLQAPAPFRAKWTEGDWAESREVASTGTTLGIHFADIRPDPNRSGPIRFTFFWTDTAKWEGREFQVALGEGPKE